MYLGFVGLIATSSSFIGYPWSVEDWGKLWSRRVRATRLVRKGDIAECTLKAEQMACVRNRTAKSTLSVEETASGGFNRFLYRKRAKINERKMATRETGSPGRKRQEPKNLLK